MPSAGREVLFGQSHWDWAFDQSSRWFSPRASLSEGHCKPTGFNQSHSTESTSSREATSEQKVMGFGIKLGFQSSPCSLLVFLNVESVAWFL